MNALDFLYAIVGTATAPFWARKARGGWAQRFGRTPALPEKSRSRALLHAVSVGEVNALRTLVPLLTPTMDVVVSATTDTGLARARELFSGTAAVVRYPLDFSRGVARFLDAVQPDAVALVELEIWPNFIAQCRRRGIPVAVVNGRLSERSFRGYRRIRRFMRASFSSLRFAAVQDSDYAARFEFMGVPPERCLVTGSMKWDAAPGESVASRGDSHTGPPPSDRALRLAELMGIDRNLPLIVAGSTGPGEEALLHSACPPGVQLLCAPRRPERFDEAAAALPGCVRRSTFGPGSKQSPSDQTRVAVEESPGQSYRFLLDSIGELRDAYSLATVVVVGRSFGGLFGSDPVEPVAMGKPTVIGPSFGDFEQAVRALRDVGGLVVTSRAELSSDLFALVAEPERRALLRDRGLECVREHRGASLRHASLVGALFVQSNAEHANRFAFSEKGAGVGGTSGGDDTPARSVV